MSNWTTTKIRGNGYSIKQFNMFNLYLFYKRKVFSAFNLFHHTQGRQEPTLCTLHSALADMFWFLGGGGSEPPDTADTSFCMQILSFNCRHFFFPLLNKHIVSHFSAQRDNLMQWWKCVNWNWKSIVCSKCTWATWSHLSLLIQLSLSCFGCSVCTQFTIFNHIYSQAAKRNTVVGEQFPSEALSGFLH